MLGRMAGLELWGAGRGEHAALIRELGATPVDYQRLWYGLGDGTVRRSEVPA